MANKTKRMAFSQRHMFVDFYHVAMIANTNDSDEHLNARCDKASYYMERAYKACMMQWVLHAPDYTDRRNYHDCNTVSGDAA